MWQEKTLRHEPSQQTETNAKVDKTKREFIRTDNRFAYKFNSLDIHFKLKIKFQQKSIHMISSDNPHLNPLKLVALRQFHLI
jgi:hypothetical protein